MTAATVKSRKGRICAALFGGAAGNALQSAFICTELPLELTRKRIEVVVITGTHLDWCLEGNARVARDFGYVPIIIGDATGAETVEQEQAAFERLNKYFAPVITSHQFVEYLGYADTSVRTS